MSPPGQSSFAVEPQLAPPPLWNPGSDLVFDHGRATLAHRLVSRISQRLVAAELEELTTVLEGSLAEIGPTFELETCSLLRRSESDQRLELVASWCAGGSAIGAGEWLPLRASAAPLLDTPCPLPLLTMAENAAAWAADPSAERLLALPMVQGSSLLGYFTFTPQNERVDADDRLFLSLLANAFAQALGRRAAAEAIAQGEERLRHALQLEAVGRLAGGIAHDFNNLLTAILGHCDLLRIKLEAGSPLLDDVEQIRAVGYRGAQLVRQLLAFGRQQVLQLQPVSLSSLSQDLKPLLTRLVGDDIEMRMVLATDPCVVMADPVQIERVMVNLAINSRDAISRRGQIVISTELVELDSAAVTDKPGAREGTYVLLTVADSGQGMSAEACARAFEPFFTTKPPGEGTGLGLSIVYGIVKQCGGYVEIESGPGAGAAVRIYLPRHGAWP